MSNTFNHEEWNKKKDDYSKWYPEPTTADLYKQIDSLSKKVKTLIEQNKDILSLLLEVVGGEEENEEIGIVEVVLTESSGSADSGCGTNCQCVGSPKFPLGGNTALDDVRIWLEQQIAIWGRNDEIRAAGYRNTLEHINRLRNYIGE